jgi:hypothetical protein
MVESCHKLIMEITNKIGLNRMGEDAEDEEDKDHDDGGDAIAPPAAVPLPVPAPPAVAREVIVVK